MKPLSEFRVNLLQVAGDDINPKKNLLEFSYSSTAHFNLLKSNILLLVCCFFKGSKHNRAKVSSENMFRCRDSWELRESWSCPGRRSKDLGPSKWPNLPWTHRHCLSFLSPQRDCQRWSTYNLPSAPPGLGAGSNTGTKRGMEGGWAQQANKERTVCRESKNHNKTDENSAFFYEHHVLEILNNVTANILLSEKSPLGLSYK